MRTEKSLGGIRKQVSVMLNMKLTLSGQGGLERDSCRMTEVHVATFTVKSYCCYRATASTCLACYRFIKRSTRINKLFLREGLVLTSFDVNVTLTSL